MPHEQEQEDDDGKIWVTSAPDEKGNYHLSFEFGPDDAVGITEAEAVNWASYVVTTAACVAHDAALFRTVRSSNLPVESAVMLVSQARARRDTLPTPEAVGVSLEPGITSDGRAFIVLRRRGQRLGQWTVEDCRQHAIGILEASIVTALDHHVYVTLRENVGAPHEVALRMVSAMGDARE